MQFLNYDGLVYLWGKIKKYTNDSVGKIDLSLYKVVSSLPTSDIDVNKIYLVVNSKTGARDQYAEYVYTGDASATYDSTKWERLGVYNANIDLTQYQTVSDATSKYNTLNTAIDKKANKATTLAGYGITDAKISGNVITLGSSTITPIVEANLTGYTTSGKNYKIQKDSNGNYYVNVPWTDNNTTYTAGTGLSLSGTTFSLALTKALVTTALGYTPPTADTNTHYASSSGCFRYRHGKCGGFKWQCLSQPH